MTPSAAKCYFLATCTSLQLDINLCCMCTLFSLLFLCFVVPWVLLKPIFVILPTTIDLISYLVSFDQFSALDKLSWISPARWAGKVLLSIITHDSDPYGALGDTVYGNSDQRVPSSSFNTKTRSLVILGLVVAVYCCLTSRWFVFKTGASTAVF